jgi:hypothetical protein
MTTDCSTNLFGFTEVEGRDVPCPMKSRSNLESFEIVRISAGSVRKMRTFHCCDYSSNVGVEFRNPGRRSVGLHMRVIVVGPPERREVPAEV